MLTRPVFKPHLNLAIVPNEGVYLLSGSKQVVLRGRLYELIAPHVDGSTADEICDRLRHETSEAEIYFTLAQLEKKGCLTEANDSLGRIDQAWWSLQHIDPNTAFRQLQERSVSLQGIGVDPKPLEELLGATGVKVKAGGDLAVVVVDQYLQSELEEWNASSIASGRPWLIAKPLGTELWLGPMFQPGKTGCWRCLSERLRSNRSVESYLRDRLALDSTSAADHAGTAAGQQVAWGLIANAIASWVVRGDLPECEGKVRTFDQLSWQVQTHTLMKLPYCTACSEENRSNHEPKGEANGHTSHECKSKCKKSNGHIGNGHASLLPEGRFRPVVFQSRKKTSIRDGGNRVIPPEETLSRYGHHVSSITGAVSMLERTTIDGDATMHVYLAGQNLARRHRSLGQLQADLRNMSAGKGTSDAQAKASGLCEALERHSGVFRGDEPRKTARLCELGDAGIDPGMCMLYSDRQYRERDVANAKPSHFNFVPCPFDPNALIAWSPVWSLSRQVVRYLPTSFCYYDYADPGNHQYCIACSNGSAAGNTIEEAVLQGFFELVERDSVALWWYNRVQRPGVDLDSFQEPYLSQLIDCLDGHQREMFVLDLTSDLQIPVFAAWCRRKNANPTSADNAEQIVLGFGAHLDARIALLRAVTEMNQMLSYLLRSPADKVYGDPVSDHETAHWLKTATMENQPYLVPASDCPQRNVRDYQSPQNDDVTMDLYECQRRVEQLGMEMLVLDQTRPEVGLPVVKVIVPGLRHFWARFAPGRLYDVPVKLGWLEQPTAEQDLNPIPMFL